MGWYKSKNNELTSEDLALLNRWRNQQLQLHGEIDSFWEDEYIDTLRRRKIKEVSRISESADFQIILYRGFDADLESLSRTSSGDYVLSPERSEQGVIWFAHSLQRNPEQYYLGRGRFALQYPIIAKAHYDKVKYDNGEVKLRLNEQISHMANDFENSRFMNDMDRTIELPDGFLFSYKVQKHIICEKKIYVPPEMISEQLSYKLESLRPQIAQVAQQEIDAWQQDEEGFDEELGHGGCCDRIAYEISNLLSGEIDGIKIKDWGEDGEDHAAIIVYNDSEAYYVDIPPNVYETGSGYQWKKKPDVIVSPNNVLIDKINRSDIVDDYE